MQCLLQATRVEQRSRRERQENEAAGAGEREKKEEENDMAPKMRTMAQTGCVLKFLVLCMQLYLVP